MSTDRKTASRRHARDSRVAVAASTALLLALVVLAGCSGRTDNGSRRMTPTGSGGVGVVASQPGAAATVGNAAGAGAVAGSAASTGTGVGKDAGARSVTDGGAAQQAPCTTAGSTRICCNRGTQTCGGSTEFLVWGPCLDSAGSTVVCDACATEFKNCDAGMDSGKPPPPPPPVDSGTDSGKPDGGCGPGMLCKPGAIRYCDVAGFEFTKAECTAMGQWGPCQPTTPPAGWCDPTGFSPEICCPPLKLCCQNDPGGAFEDWGSGACAGTMCTAR